MTLRHDPSPCDGGRCGYAALHQSPGQTAGASLDRVACPFDTRSGPVRPRQGGGRKRRGPRRRGDPGGPGLVAGDGRLSSEKLDRHQHAAHGLAWLATYVEAVRELSAYAERLAAEGRLGETEELLVRIGLGEYLAQIFGGIPMSQGEIVRLADLGLGAREVAARFATTPSRP